MPYSYCSLPNIQGKGYVAELISDDPDEVATFIKTWDVPGRGVYHCPNRLVADAPARRIEYVECIEKIFVDIDYRSLEISPAAIEDKLLQLPVEPSEVISSGRGLHLYWWLKEPVYATDPVMFERARRLQKELAARLSADPIPTHPAALMRVVGTHNSKVEGEPALVQEAWGSGCEGDITELEDLLDSLPAEGLFKRKGNGHANGASVTDPGQWKEPVDVGARLAEVGPGNIHNTELSCTASLMRSGYSVDAAVLTVIEEMQRSMGAGVADWDLADEELKLRRQCTDFVNKYPNLSNLLPDNLRDPFETALAAGKRAAVTYDKRTGWHVRSYVETPTASPETSSKGPDQSAPRAYRFKLVPFSELRPGPKPLYLVDELIPVAGLVDVWGKAKCYKSFWTLDLMLHVALGWEYRDRAVQQGTVVYCAFEGAHGYDKRVEALRRHYNIADDANVPLHVMKGQANLITEHRLLISDIVAQLGEGAKPAAVVLDTLNKSLVGSENKDVDMSAYVRAAEAIRDRFGCVVIIIHHCGYDETRPRGHSSLPGAVDAQLSVVRSENIITVTVEMMRDGPEEAQVVSATEIVEVGTDQTGKILTSLVVVPSESEAAGIKQGWPRGLTVFHATLKAALAANGEVFQPEPGVLPVRAVGLSPVRERFYKSYAEAEDDPKKRAEKIRKAFNRAMADAQSRGLLRVRHLDTGQTMLWAPERGEGF